MKSMKPIQNKLMMTLVLLAFSFNAFIAHCSKADSTYKFLYRTSDTILYSKEYFRYDSKGRTVSDSMFIRDTTIHNKMSWGNNSSCSKYLFDANGNQLVKTYFSINNATNQFYLGEIDSSRYDKYNHATYSSTTMNNTSNITFYEYNYKLYSVLHNNIMYDTLVIGNTYGSGKWSMSDRGHYLYDNQWRKVSYIDSGYQGTNWKTLIMDKFNYVHTTLYDSVYENFSNMFLVTMHYQTVNVTNASGQNIAYIFNQWDGTNAPTQYSKKELTYNNNGDVSIYRYYTYSDGNYQLSQNAGNLGQTIDCALDSVWYDSNHNDTLHMKYIVTNSALVRFKKIEASCNLWGKVKETTYSWNGSKFVLSAIQYWYGTKENPVITWSNPANINDITPLSSAQLNATANVDGTFTYTPPAGTTLSKGQGKLLKVEFVPADEASYNSVSKTVTINVVSYTGISQTDQTETRLYPNPADHSFTIESPEKITSVVVSTIDGRVALEEKQENVMKTSIDVGGLNSGLYMVTIKTTSNKNIVKKLIVKVR